MTKATRLSPTVPQNLPKEPSLARGDHGRKRWAMSMSDDHVADHPRWTQGSPNIERKKAFN